MQRPHSFSSAGARSKTSADCASVPSSSHFFFTAARPRSKVVPFPEASRSKSKEGAEGGKESGCQRTAGKGGRPERYVKGSTGTEPHDFGRTQGYKGTAERERGRR